MTRLTPSPWRTIWASAGLSLLLAGTAEKVARPQPAASPPAAPSAAAAVPAPPTATPAPAVPAAPAPVAVGSPTGAAAAPPPALVPPAQQAIPHESFVMHNGLRVILQQDSRSPFVLVCVVYHVGAYDEQPGKSGLAHLFEHLMFEGSRGTLPRNAFQTLNQMGYVDANGVTSWEHTYYYETVPAINLESALWLEADRMVNLTGAEDGIHQTDARNIVKNERRQRLETVPYRAAEQALAMQLFPPPHPYSRDLIGSFDDLDGATTKDLSEFYRTFYGPNNATLVIIGDVAPGEARQLVSKYFGPLGRRGTPLRQPWPPPPPPRTPRLQVKDPLATTPALFIGWPTPPLYSQEDRIADVAAMILYQRLFRRLVRTLAVASRVQVGQLSRGGQSLFRINLFARSASQLTKAQGLADAILEELRQDTATPEEVTQARLTLITDRYWALESPLSRALSLASWTRFHSGVDLFRETLAGYQRITPADIGRFAREALRPEARVAVEVEPSRGQQP